MAGSAAPSDSNAPVQSGAAGGSGRAGSPREPLAGKSSTAAVGGAGMPVAGSSGAAAVGGDAGAGGAPGTTRPEWLYGVTVDNIQPLDQIVTSLRMLAKRPTTRVVFDPGVAPAHYRAAVQQIHSVSGVMGELVDSFGVADISLADYGARTSEYLDGLGDDVDIWEIGNEVNGEWLGAAADVSAKIEAAYRLVHQRGKVAALTLYYNKGCVQQPANEMFTWVQRNVSDELKQGLEYVLVSFYDDDCNNTRPDWNAVFKQLSRIFPNSKLGFGECGTEDAAKKLDFIQRYYNLQVDEPSFVGGYFWWYYRQDMLPYTSALWSALNDSIQRTP